MNVGLDARFAAGRRRGIGKYSYHLIRGLTHEPGIQLFLYIACGDLPADILSCQNVTIRRIASGFYPVWEQVLLPLAVRRDGLDIFHSLGNTGPVRGIPNCKFVLTIHDVMYLDTGVRFTGIYQRIGNAYRRCVVPVAARSADLILTDSVYSRSDILRRISLDAARIRVVHLGVESHEGPFGVRRAHQEKTIVVLAAKDPRKNTMRALRCFAELPRDVRVRLKLVGTMPGDMPDVDELVRDLHLNHDVDYCGFVSDQELLRLYSSSTMLFYPSLSEGFGLPVLEAMSCGCPVIASDRCSIPEVAGEAALLVDPEDEPAMVSAIRQLLADESLQQTLAARGVVRASQFSWEATAGATLTAYREVLRSP